MVIAVIPECLAIQSIPVPMSCVIETWNAMLTTIITHLIEPVFVLFPYDSSQLSALESSEEDSRQPRDHSAARHQDGKDFFQHPVIIAYVWKLIM